MVEIVHKIPEGDIIEHDESMNCVCGPTVSSIEPQGTAVTVTHYSLDNREQFEIPDGEDADLDD